MHGRDFQHGDSSFGFSQLAGGKHGSKLPDSTSTYTISAKPARRPSVLDVPSRRPPASLLNPAIALVTRSFFRLNNLTGVPFLRRADRLEVTTRAGSSARSPSPIWRACSGQIRE
ncbi:MAG: hypothetical protein MZV64_23940 [Ignavibacteriales bacterium]|nr:hypothetical protein [Ignavibacteriales bacterium]